MCCIARGTLLSIMCQPGWEGLWEENQSWCMLGWVSSVFTWSYHNIVKILQYKVFWVLKINKVGPVGGGASRAWQSRGNSRESALQTQPSESPVTKPQASLGAGNEPARAKGRTGQPRAVKATLTSCRCEVFLRHLKRQKSPFKVWQRREKTSELQKTTEKQFQE